MKRCGEIALQVSRSSRKPRLCSPLLTVWAWSFEMPHTRTATLRRGLVTFGGRWLSPYASVSTRISGYFFSISSATALTKRRRTPDDAPSSATTARQGAHWHHPAPSL